MNDLAVLESVRYLESSESGAAMSSIEKNCYWPKWNSPWWHISLLHEMGLARKIPQCAIRKMADQLKASPLTIFPIHAEDLPEGLDPVLETHCHCALGNIYQALSAAGLDVDEELPWIRAWFLRYQLPDGGLNCDNDAYLKNDPPSSMVATVSPLEAILFYTSRPFTHEEENFLDRGAQCLLDRQLMHATANPHNVDERQDEKDWLKLCFPRFYFYDVLRGLSFILKWAQIRKKPVPEGAIREVVQYLKKRFPNGQVTIERRSYESVLTRAQVESGAWERTAPSTFRLLEQVSEVGKVSPYLTSQWEEAQSNPAVFLIMTPV